MSQHRTSGILIHPSSLPGPHGIGSLGIQAYRFVDFLAACGHSLWQILPLGPTGHGDSPYSAFSAFAGNPLLICLERLVETGELDPQDIAGVSMEEGRTNFRLVRDFKEPLLRKAARAFGAGGDPQRQQAFADFCREQAGWLPCFRPCGSSSTKRAGTIGRWRSGNAGRRPWNTGERNWPNRFLRSAIPSSSFLNSGSP